MPVPREIPPPPPEMTERVVAAALAALPPRRRRRRTRFAVIVGVGVVAAVAFGFALAPSSSGLDFKAPLKFTSISRGSASGGPVAQVSEATWFASAQSEYKNADGVVRQFGLGRAAVKAVDRYDYNHHFVVVVIRRDHPVRVRKLLLRRLSASRLQLCIFTAPVTGTPRNNYGYDILWVRKTFGINHVVPLLDQSYAVIFGADGKLEYPPPPSLVRPSLCR